MALGVAIAGLVVAVAGTAVSVVKQNKAAEEVRKEKKTKRNIDRRVSQLQSQRRIRLAQAARNRERGRIVASAETGGLGASSGAQGAIGSLRTQTASNIGFSNTLTAASNLRADVGLRGFIRSSKLLGDANLAEGAGDIGESVFNFASSRIK